MNAPESAAVGAGAASPGAWVSDYAPKPGARSRLILIHHAGGGASAFRNWRRHFPPDLEPVALQMPGRENRFREAAYENAEGIGLVLARALAPLADLPIAVFGHSMGAMLAFELACGLESMGLPVGHLFVSSRWAPHAPPGRGPTYGLSKAEFRRRLGEFGGTPAALLENEDLMALFEPVLRADLKMNETYLSARTEPLGCPITAFAAENDPLAPPSSVADWRRWTKAAFAMETVPGDHFHFRTDPGRIVRAIASRFP